jgi:hypothetical protein
VNNWKKLKTTISLGQNKAYLDGNAILVFFAVFGR